MGGAWMGMERELRILEGTRRHNFLLLFFPWMFKFRKCWLDFLVRLEARIAMTWGMVMPLRLSVWHSVPQYTFSAMTPGQNRYLSVLSECV